MAELLLEGPSGERLPLNGTFNVRDAGGYLTADGRLRRGLLLRGDAPGALDAESLTLLGELGLRTVIDLRAPGERLMRPTRLEALSGVRIVELPLLDPADGDLPAALVEGGLPALYRWLVLNRGHRLADVIRVLAQEDALPALVHCSAGKDRTGMVVALVHAVLGVADDDLAGDFGRSEALLGADFVAAAQAQAAALGIDATLRPELLASDPAWIRQVLELVRAGHGDASAYLTAHGLTETDLRGLRRALLDPDADPITTDPMERS
jgi:protein-tyrosine phosphatase